MWFALLAADDSQEGSAGCLHRSFFELFLLISFLLSERFLLLFRPSLSSLFFFFRVREEKQHLGKLSLHSTMHELTNDVIRPARDNGVTRSSA